MATSHLSFVILHSGTPFEKKGGGELALPKMDVPIGLVEWEVFLPERYRVKDFGGDAMPAALLPREEEFNRFQGLEAMGMTRWYRLQAGSAARLPYDVEDARTGTLKARCHATPSHRPRIVPPLPSGEALPRSAVAHLSCHVRALSPVQLEI